MQLKQADRAAIDDVFREQLAPLLKSPSPALGGGILVAAQRDMVCCERGDIQPQAPGKCCKSLGETRSTDCQFAIIPTLIVMQKR